ncbi:hypothetical protein HZS_5687, partial [Henneguya salminicola]
LELLPNEVIVFSKVFIILICKRKTLVDGPMDFIWAEQVGCLLVMSKILTKIFFPKKAQRRILIEAARILTIMYFKKSNPSLYNR